MTDEGLVCSTFFEQHESEFKWTIADFNLMNIEQTIKLESKEFVVRTEPRVTGHFETTIVYSMENRASEPGYSVNFHFGWNCEQMAETPQEPIELRTKLTVYDTKSNQRIRKIKPICGQRIIPCQSNEPYIPHLVVNSFICKKLIPDKAYILFECTFLYMGVQDESNSVEITKRTRMETLTEDISKLFLNKDWSDLKIEVGDTKFHAHKTVLAARSKVFGAMFTHDMKETRTGVVHISNIDPEIFREMLRFIYTGKVENIRDVAVKLFWAADEYDLEELKRECLNAIPKNLSSQSALEDFMEQGISQSKKGGRFSYDSTRNCDTSFEKLTSTVAHLATKCKTTIQAFASNK